MALAEERKRILEMVADGTISAADGVRLIEALGSGEDDAESAASPQTQARWFRVRVTDLETGRDKVNINIPIGLVNVGLKMGARFVEEDQDIDFDALAAAVQAGQTGKILDVEDSEDGERVEIYVE